MHLGNFRSIRFALLVNKFLILINFWLANFRGRLAGRDAAELSVLFLEVSLYSLKQRLAHLVFLSIFRCWGGSKFRPA